MWIVLGLVVGWMSGIVPVLTEDDERVRWVFVRGGVAFFGMFLGMFLYVNMYIRWKEGVRPHYRRWRVYFPRIVPVATVSGVLGVICFSIGLWNVYGMYTVLVVGMLGMGMFHLLSLF